MPYTGIDPHLKHKLTGKDRNAKEPVAWRARTQAAGRSAKGMTEAPAQNHRALALPVQQSWLFLSWLTTSPP